MIDIADIRGRWRKAVTFLDERGRRLFAANEALAQGHGGVTATSIATGLARSTIDRGMPDLRSARNELGARLRRPGAGRKSAVTQQPELPAALERLIEDAIRGDPTSPLRWVSRSQRHLVKALTAQGFKVSQRVVGKLLLSTLAQVPHTPAIESKPIAEQRADPVFVRPALAHSRGLCRPVVKFRALPPSASGAATAAVPQLLSAHHSTPSSSPSAGHRDQALKS